MRFGARHSLATTASASICNRTPPRSFANVGVDTGFELQLAVLDGWLADGEQVGGWKIGLTSRRARLDGQGHPPARLRAGLAGAGLQGRAPGEGRKRSLGAEIGVVLGPGSVDLADLSLTSCTSR